MGQREPVWSTDDTRQIKGFFVVLENFGMRCSHGREGSEGQSEH